MPFSWQVGDYTPAAAKDALLVHPARLDANYFDDARVRVFFRASEMHLLSCTVPEHPVDVLATFAGRADPAVDRFDVPRVAARGARGGGRVVPAAGRRFTAACFCARVVAACAVPNHSSVRTRIG